VTGKENKMPDTYEQGLANLAKNSDRAKMKRARIRSAVKIWNACSKFGMRGMQGAEFLKEVGFTNTEIKVVVKKFLDAK
jgi:hypothetical protein